MRNRWMRNSLPCEWTLSKAQRGISDKSDIIREIKLAFVPFSHKLCLVFFARAPIMTKIR